MTTVLLMDPDGTRLWQGVGPLVPPGWICAINPVPVAVDAGLCGTAAFLKARLNTKKRGRHDSDHNVEKLLDDSLRSSEKFTR